MRFATPFAPVALASDSRRPSMAVVVGDTEQRAGIETI